MFAHVSVRKLKISLKEALIVSFFIHVVFLSSFQASTMAIMTSIVNYFLLDAFLANNCFILGMYKGT